ncbi:putative small integral membrane protein [Bradyrhizobium sp. JR6.1]
MLARDQRTPFSDWWWTVDKLLLVAIAALMLAGVILSLAASPPVATRIGLDPFHFFNRHVMFLVPSLIVLIGVSFMTPRQIRRTALIVFAVSIVLIVLTLLIGPERSRAHGAGSRCSASTSRPPKPPSPPSSSSRPGCLRNRPSGRRCRRPRWRWCC